VITAALTYVTERIRLMATAKEHERQMARDSERRTAQAGSDREDSPPPTLGDFSPSDDARASAAPTTTAPRRVHRRNSGGRPGKPEDEHTVVLGTIARFSLHAGAVTLPGAHLKLCNNLRRLGTTIALTFTQELMGPIRAWGGAKESGTDRTDFLQFHDREHWRRETKEDIKGIIDGDEQEHTAECPQVIFAGATQPVAWLELLKSDNNDGLMSRFGTYFPRNEFFDVGVCSVTCSPSLQGLWFEL
jgi:hypothetical protein